jgi:hypothetical protein
MWKKSELPDIGALGKDDLELEKLRAEIVSHHHSVRPAYRSPTVIFGFVAAGVSIVTLWMKLDSSDDARRVAELSLANSQLKLTIAERDLESTTSELATLQEAQAALGEQVRRAEEELAYRNRQLEQVESKVAVLETSVASRELELAFAEDRLAAVQGRWNSVVELGLSDESLSREALLDNLMAAVTEDYKEFGLYVEEMLACERPSGIPCTFICGHAEHAYVCTPYIGPDGDIYSGPDVQRMEAAEAESVAHLAALRKRFPWVNEDE